LAKALTTAQAAAFVRCHPVSLWRWERDGHLSADRDARGRKCYRRRDLVRMLEWGSKAWQRRGRGAQASDPR
jgi:DNA-binding transcriptional MerR regulator